MIDPLLIELLQNSCKVICTEIVTQELLHKSSANFQVIKFYLNSRKIRLLQFFYFSLRHEQRRLTKCCPCRTPKHVVKCGSCLSLGNPLRRSRVSDGQRCGVVKCESSLPAATVCGDRACRTPEHVVECGISFGYGQPSAEIAQVGRPSMWQNVNLVRPGATPSHESQTAIIVGKLRLFNVRCKRSRIGDFIHFEPSGTTGSREIKLV